MTTFYILSGIYLLIGIILSNVHSLGVNNVNNNKMLKEVLYNLYIVFLWPIDLLVRGFWTLLPKNHEQDENSIADPVRSVDVDVTYDDDHENGKTENEVEYEVVDEGEEDEEDADEEEDEEEDEEKVDETKDNITHNYLNGIPEFWVKYIEMKNSPVTKTFNGVKKEAYKVYYISTKGRCVRNFRLKRGTKLLRENREHKMDYGWFDAYKSSHSGTGGERIRQRVSIAIAHYFIKPIDEKKEDVVKKDENLPYDIENIEIIDAQTREFIGDVNSLGFRSDKEIFQWDPLNGDESSVNLVTQKGGSTTLNGKKKKNHCETMSEEAYTKYIENFRETIKSHFINTVQEMNLKRFKYGPVKERVEGKLVDEGYEDILDHLKRKNPKKEPKNFIRNQFEALKNEGVFSNPERGVYELVNANRFSFKD